MKFLRYLFLLMTISFLAGESIYAQDNVLLVTYGPTAPTREGDDDFKQIIFFKVPQNIKDSLYLRIFDADNGGLVDSPFDKFDTETRFSFYGGSGAFSKSSLSRQNADSADLYAGTIIADGKFGVDPFLDNKWFNFANFAAQQGELIDGFYYFKLVVEGVSGNDGNLFDVTVSRQDKRNILPQGVEIFSYTPTLRLPGKGIFAEMKFLVPENSPEIIIKNFDLAGGKVAVETPFRSNLSVVSSAQDVWAESSILFEERELGLYSALKFEGGGEIPNDATFHLVSKQGKAIPFDLPFYIRKQNRRPVPVELVKTLSDCYTVVFDGSKSSDPDGEALSFFWKFGDGKTATGTRIAHTYEKFGTYEAELIVTDASGQVGNSSYKRFKVVLNVPPVASAGPDLTVAPNQVITLNAGESKDPDGAISKYYWEFSDGTKAEGISVAKAFSKSGIYSVFLRVEDNSESPCNFDTDQIKVWVNAQPIVDIGPDLISAVGQEVDFDGGKSYDSDGELAQYLWDFGDGNKGEGLYISHTYAKPGKYTVTLTVVDNASVTNSNAVDQLVITVNDKPVAEAGPDKIVAVGEVVPFDGTGSIDRDGKIIEYKWDFGDGGKGTGDKPTHIYKKSGKYLVKLVVKDNSTSISELDSDSLVITVNYPPVSRAGEDQHLTNSEVRFDGSASSDEDGTITAYYWDFGDNTFSSEPKPVKYYARPGVYKVALKVTDDTKVSSNNHTDELKVVVNARPLADAGPDKIAIPGQKIAFDGGGSKDPDGSVEKYIWNFGDGQSAEGKKVEHSYAAPGKYNVSLKVYDNSGHSEAFDIDEAIMTINDAPVIIAGPDMIASPGQLLTFDGTRSFDRDGKLQNAEWRFSDTDAVFKGLTVKKSFKKPGLYKVTLSAEDNGTANNSLQQSSLNVYVNSKPTSRAGTDLVTCDNTIRFDGSGSTDPEGHPLIYIWDFGDGTRNDTGRVLYHTYKRPGTYPVILTVDDGQRLDNSTHSSSITIEINQAPVADAGKDKIVCSGEIVLFDGSGSYDPDGGLLKYFWEFGDGTTAEGQNPTKIYTKAGSYQITLRVKDDSNLPCNTDIDQMIVTVAEAPVAVAGDDQTVCANTIVEFDGSASRDYDGVVNNYNWDFGDGNSGGGAKPTHVYAKPGVYRVLLTVTGDNVGECDNIGRDEMIVTVLAAPVAKFTYPKLVALNAPVKFDGSGSSTATGKIVTYEWDFGDGTSAKGVNVTKNYTESGKFFVKLTVITDAKTGCESTNIVDFIVVNEPPVADAGPAILAGVNDIIVFNGTGSKDADGSITSLKWDFANGDTANGLEVRYQYAKSGTYIVKLTVKDDTNLPNNTASDTMVVVINEAPVPVIAAPQWGCVNAAVAFNGLSSKDADGQITFYEWNFGDGSTDSGASVNHVYTSPGTYEVTLKVKDNRNLTNSYKAVSKIIKINRPPFSYAGPDVIGCPDEILTFDGSASQDQDGEIKRYVWNFGDGKSAEGAKVQYAYTKPGNYKATLTVYDNSGTDCGIVTDEAAVLINSKPVAKIAPVGRVFTGGAHDAVLFDGSGSTDADNQALKYIWNFGDGTTADGAKVSHYFAKPGKYNVRLTVKDTTGKVCGEGFEEITIDVVKR